MVSFKFDCHSGRCRYTQKKSSSSESGYSVYAFVLDWPENNALRLEAPMITSNTRVQLLGYASDLQYSSVGTTLTVVFPYIPPNKMPCENGWMLKFDNLKNSW